MTDTAGAARTAPAETSAVHIRPDSLPKAELVAALVDAGVTVPKNATKWEVLDLWLDHVAASCTITLDQVCGR